jgi:TRAP-type C4-dicarboxylate transport system permease small subunit
MLQSIGHILERLLKLAILILMCGVVGATLLQVFSRYVVNSPFMWTEEMARYCCLWMVMLAAGLVMDKGMHIALEYVADKLPGLARKTQAALVHLLVLAFSLILFNPALEIVSRVWSTNSPALQLSMGMVYMAVPAGLSIIAAYSIVGLVRSIKSGASPATEM